MKLDLENSFRLDPVSILNDGLGVDGYNDSVWIERDQGLRTSPDCFYGYCDWAQKLEIVRFGMIYPLAGSE